MVTPISDEQVARICHEANKAFCEYLGDHSQVSWERAPVWQRESAINGVHFHRNNPDAGPNASHDNWMAEKVLAGWIYGMVKDPEASPPMHPCIVPFNELPKDQQFKDVLFRSLVHASGAPAQEDNFAVEHL